MLRMMNRLAGLDEERMAKRVLRWDIELGGVGWVRDVLNICEVWGIPSPIGPYMTLFQYDLEPIQRIALREARGHWVESAQRMPKVRTYVQIRDFMDIGTLVLANLSRGQRSTMAKLLCGILPLEIEVGRFKNVPAERRFCTLCKTEEVENEVHFVFTCEKLQVERSGTLDILMHVDNDFEELTHIESLRKLISPGRIKTFAECLEHLYRFRQDVIYKPNSTRH